MNKIAIIQGALIAAGRPLTVDDIKRLFTEEDGIPSKQEIEEMMSEIASTCDEMGFELKQLASGYRFQVRAEYANWVSRLWEEKPPKYSKALLEIMAIIAYKQPVTRAEIEEIRGVVVSTNSIRTLLDKQWIKIIAHKDVPGRPAVYGTTVEFLDYFNLSHLNELPELDLDKIQFSREVVEDSEQKGFQLQDVENAEIEDTAVEAEVDDDKVDNVIDATEEFAKRNNPEHDAQQTG